MKTLVAIILALGVGFAAAYFIVSGQKNTQPEQMKVPPPVAVAAPAPAEKIVVVPAPVQPAPMQESPQEILDDLLRMKPDAGGSRNAALRLVVFKLEMLKQCGAAAVPAIRDFIGRNVDVNYSQPDAQISDNSQPASGFAVSRVANRSKFNATASPKSAGRHRVNIFQKLQADWVVPPSLRLGLVAVLKNIGGVDSEKVMAEMLNRTGRGVEVACLTFALEEIAPGKYQNIAVAAAKELLMNPPAIDNPDSYDQLAKSYLFGVLEFYKDTSFTANAQQLLVGADGRLDQDALDFLTSVQPDQFVPALYAAYRNPALTNRADQALIRSDVLGYVGQNPQANALLADTLADPGLDARTKTFTLIGLSTGETDPQTAAAKIILFTSLESRFAGDPVLAKALPAAINALQNPDQPLQIQDIFGK